MEEAIKKIILNHYKGFRTPITVLELESMVRQSVGVNSYSQREFGDILSKLVKGKAVVKDSSGRIKPLYAAVEI